MLYITDLPALAAFCDELRSYPSIAFDTEFANRSTYFPRLRLVQVAAGPLCGVIDSYRVPTLAPLLEVLYDPAIEKVVHAGRQDLAIFTRLTGKVPAPLFDTMVAGSLLGYGAQPAYQLLVSRATGRRLAKGYANSDWDQPELTVAQLKYAAEDALYLPAVAEHLKAELAQTGRTSWAQEELERLLEPTLYLPPDPRQQYLRIRDRNHLSSRALGVLREVAAWRETTAQQVDKPRGWVIPDDALMGIARRAAGRRGFEPGDCPAGCEEHLPALQEAVRRALAGSPIESTAAPAQEENGLVELAQAFVRSRCLAENVAATVVVTRDELQALCAASDNGNGLPPLPVLSGWRREFIGDDLLALLRGELCLAVDRSSGVLVTCRSLQAPAEQATRP